jgi:ADP-ribosyl-[dinitrogen reductase] hydrolase
MLLEMAVADSYGSGFEYADESKVKEFNNLSKYVTHHRHSLKPGCYTDDTQMSIAIAEALVSKEEWTPINLANRFVACFKRDKRKGYASGFYALLERVKDGEELLKLIKPDSDKSGGAMRAPPIGILSSCSDVMEKASIQAKITHNTDAGIKAAQASAMTSHYFIYNKGPKANLGKWLRECIPSDSVDLHWDKPYQGSVGPKGWMSVRAAITALMSCDNMSDLLKASIAFTGDVDTVGAIALAAGSQSKEIVQDLPIHLINELENLAYGRDFLIALDCDLMELKIL